MDSTEGFAVAIEAAWEIRKELTPETGGPVREAVNEALDGLDIGRYRAAEKTGDKWKTNSWLLKAVLLSFRLTSNFLIEGGPGGATWWDKAPGKFAGWGPEDFTKAGFRAVAGSLVRRSAFIAPDAVLMPSFVNMGAYVGEGTMIDAWSTVGTCVQVGRKCHISGGVGLGGVAEPAQLNPVIIEDNCFIGARSEVVEGVIVRQGSVLGMGVFIGASTKIINRQTGEIHQGEVPEYSVVVPGSLPPEKPTLQNGAPAPSTYCAVIVKRVDALTRAKTSVNELLRM